MSKLLLILALNLPASAQMMQAIVGATPHASGPAPITFVSSDANTGNLIDTVTITRAIPAGNFLFLKANYDAGGAGGAGCATKINNSGMMTRDSMGTPLEFFTELGTAEEHAYECSKRYALFVTAAATDIRITWTEPLVVTFDLLNFSGVPGPADGSSAAALATSGSTLTSDPFTTTHANNLTLAATAGYYAATYTAGSGFTLPTGPGDCSSAIRICIAYKIETSIQTAATTTMAVSGGGSTTYHDFTVDSFKGN